MRILILGAGATGGYFGGRLLQHGRDVTFLVRAGRAAELARHGLVIHSPTGNAELAAPPTVLASELSGPYDLVVITCKAYGLEQALADMAPAVGPQTAILPILNGMRQLDLLDARFGADRVLGGQCVIAATLGNEGSIEHLNKMHSLTFGERDGRSTARMQRITQAFSDAGFDSRPRANVLQEMWNKWMFLAALAGITCLMRGSVGAVAAAPGGTAAALRLLDECRAVAERAGHAPSPETMQRARGVLTEPGSMLTASMLRDLQHGYPIEADHIVGDMLARAADQGVEHSLLAIVYAHLKVYEAGRQSPAA